MKRDSICASSFNVLVPITSVSHLIYTPDGKLSYINWVRLIRARCFGIFILNTGSGVASKDKVTKIILESNKEYLLSKFWGKNNGQISPLSSRANNPTPHSLLSRMIAPSGISFGWKSFNFLSWTPSLLDSKNMIHDHLGKRGNASEKTGRLARHSRAHLVSHQLY